VEAQAKRAMRSGGKPVTFRVGPRAEPPGGPRSWGDSTVGISWRRGVGGREDTELLSNTWGAEGGSRFGGWEFWDDGRAGQWPRHPRDSGLGWHPHLATHHGHWLALPSILPPPSPPGHPGRGLAGAGVLRTLEHLQCWRGQNPRAVREGGSPAFCAQNT
jgi:hypothetical protein